jgi:hypothetical protein
MGTKWGDCILYSRYEPNTTKKPHKCKVLHTIYTHPMLICRGTDGRTENIYSIFGDKLLLLGRNLHLFPLKMLITATTAVTFPVFAVFIAISLALIVSLGAVLTTLIGWGSVDE